MAIAANGRSVAAAIGGRRRGSCGYTHKGRQRGASRGGCGHQRVACVPHVNVFDAIRHVREKIRRHRGESDELARTGAVPIDARVLAQSIRRRFSVHARNQVRRCRTCGRRARASISHVNLLDAVGGSSQIRSRGGKCSKTAVIRYRRLRIHTASGCRTVGSRDQSHGGNTARGNQLALILLENFLRIAWIRRA